MDLFLNPEINFCTCGCEARLIKNPQKSPKSDKKRFDYWVECLDDSCKNKGHVENQSWKAILSWNGSLCSDFPEIIEIPFLSIVGLNQEEIENKVHELEKQLQSQANKSYKSGRPLPQKTYIELKAKLAWLGYLKNWLNYYFKNTEASPSEDDSEIHQKNKVSNEFSSQQ